MQEPARRSNKERSEQTRKALIAAARKLFVKKGYAETGTPEIVRAAQVTRGALYHHFDGKTGLFLAVIEEEARLVEHKISRSVADADTSLAALLSGSDAFLSAMAAPGRAQLLLVDGPSILGHAKMNEINQLAGGAAFRQGLNYVMSDQQLDAETFEAAIDVLSAAFDRAALALADGRDAAAYRSALRLLLTKLAANGGSCPP